jgi:hypothetical protein
MMSLRTCSSRWPHRCGSTEAVHLQVPAGLLPVQEEIVHLAGDIRG